MIPEIRWSRPDAKMSTDTCLTACGGWSEGDYFHSQFPKAVLQQPNVRINELECLAIVIALKLWSNKYRGSNLLLYCDNQSTVQIVNKGHARNRFAQKCLHEIVWICANSDLWIKVVYSSSKTNRLADLCSRFALKKDYKKQFLSETEGLRKKNCLVSNEMYKFSHDW